MNKAILFDLDGTLVETAPDLMSAHNHVMEKYGFFIFFYRNGNETHLCHSFLILFKLGAVTTL